MESLQKHVLIESITIKTNKIIDLLGLWECNELMGKGTKDFLSNLKLKKREDARIVKLVSEIEYILFKLECYDIDQLVSGLKHG
jgi:hypothetical protein